MIAGRWAELKLEFAALADLPADARAGRLAALARTDPELHALLDALLRADGRADALLQHVVPIALPDAVHEMAGADPFDLVGSTVARFRILDVLGRGGMGVVYRAEDLRLGRTVALKFMLPQFSHDPAAGDRFLKEARAASALDHPNVCTVYETGQAADGRAFLVMAYYAGETLKARLAAESVLGVAAAIDIAAQTLRGLGAAHRAGVIHRDLKPGNLLVAPDGTVRILDFGLALARDDGGPAAEGVPPGTLAYMSPELLDGRPVDHRTDLWSLGVVLYEMLTGKTPFRRDHEHATIAAILHDVPAAASRLRTELPVALDTVVNGLLCKDPDGRFASAEQALAALTAATAGDAATAGAAAPSRTRALTRLAAAMVVAGAVTVAAAVATRAMRAGQAPAAAVIAGAAAAGNSIAVLPFADLSAGRDEDYFSEGVAEEILNALHTVPELRVTSRTSAFSFRNSQLPAREIARRLGVRTLLGGSVRRSGTRLRITAWLVDAQSDRELWAESFEGELHDVAAVQTTIVRAALAATEVRLAAGQSVDVRQATLSHAAHAAYLQGLFHWHRRTPPHIETAIEYFERAVTADSTFARAYAGLALAHAVLPLLRGRPAGDAMPAIEAAAARALALDSTLADPHAALGYGYHQQWRWADAERAFRRALELDPDHVTALQWHGEHAVKMGRPEEAERLLRRAVERDPLSVIAHANLGLVLWLSERTTDAIAQFERARSLDPGFAVANLFLFRAHLTVGDFERAAAAGRTWAEVSGQMDPADIEALMPALRGAAPRAQALAVLARWEPAPQNIVDAVLLASLLGETARALALLERGFEDRNPLMASLQAGVWTRALRGEPRYQRLVEQMRFP